MQHTTYSLPSIVYPNPTVWRFMLVCTKKHEIQNFKVVYQNVLVHQTKLLQKKMAISGHLAIRLLRQIWTSGVSPEKNYKNLTQQCCDTFLTDFSANKKNRNIFCNYLVEKNSTLPPNKSGLSWFLVHPSVFPVKPLYAIRDYAPWNICNVCDIY